MQSAKLNSLSVIKNAELRAALVYVAENLIAVPFGKYVEGSRFPPTLLHFLNLIFKETEQRAITSDVRLRAMVIRPKAYPDSELFSELFPELVLAHIRYTGLGVTECYEWRVPVYILNSDSANALWQTAVQATAELNAAKQLVTETELAVRAAEDNLSRAQLAEFKATEEYERIKEKNK